MPDTPENVPATPENEPGESASNPPSTGLNQAQIAALAKAEDIAKTALNPAYVTQMVDSDGEPDPASDDWNITVANITALLADIAACQGNTGSAAGKTNERRLATAGEGTAEEILIREIQYIQSRAKQKHARKRPQLLRNYHIGHRLESNRDNLEQYTRDIILHATTGQLPGVNAARIAGLQGKLNAWIAADLAQGQAQGGATTLRGTIKQQLASILDRRLTLQFAADALYPYWDDNNYATRRLFHLTTNRPFDG